MAHFFFFPAHRSPTYMDELRGFPKHFLSCHRIGIPVKANTSTKLCYFQTRVLQKCAMPFVKPNFAISYSNT